MVTRRLNIFVGDCSIAGELTLPRGPEGLVIFAQGGAGRSERNRRLASLLQDEKMATLLLDLLTCSEESLDSRSGTFRFDCVLLGRRLEAVLNWAKEEPAVSDLPLGIFAVGTGAAAAILAASARPDVVRALVTEGGRPDLVPDALKLVFCPTLLLVGEEETGILELNAAAFGRLSASDKKLEIIPAGGSSGVFDASRGWFAAHLAGLAGPSFLEGRAALPAG